MSSKPAQVVRRGDKSPPKFVLLGSPLGAGITVGLRLLHGLNLHSRPAMPQYTAASVIPIFNDALNGTLAAPIHVSQNTVDTTPTRGYAGCAAHSQHLAAAAACFLALFAALILMRRPVGKILRGEWFSGPERVFSSVFRDFSRTPSLHRFCISRM